MTKDSERLIALEEEVAHLTVANEELSSEILRQWKQIEQLEKKLGHLENKLASVEDQIHAPEANQKPPHW